jgi:histone-lysine N-methyltransferase SETD3
LRILFFFLYVQRIIYHSLQTIQAGSQIFDSYGQKCNHRFLLNYGFAVEHNIELDGYCPNEVPLELRLLSSDVLHDRKFEFWCRDEAPYIKRIRVSVSNNESTKILFSMLRVVVANEQELDLISPLTSGNTMARSNAPLSPNSSAGCMLYRSCRDIRFPLSLRNETATLTHLRSIVRDALSRYPTTLAQDRIRLLDMCALPPFSNARHAAIQVNGEKEVLQYYDDLTTAALGVIDLPNEEEFDAAIKSLEGAGTHYLILRYCADIIGATRRRSQKQLRIPVRSGNMKPLNLPSTYH